MGLMKTRSWYQRRCRLGSSVMTRLRPRTSWCVSDEMWEWDWVATSQRWGAKLSRYAVQNSLMRCALREGSSSKI